MSDSHLVIAVDVGGSAMKAGLVGPDGVERVRLDRRTPAADGPDAVVSELLHLVEDLAAAADAPLAAAGVIVPGVVDPIAGVASYATNLGWTDVPLRELLVERLGVPVAVDHDVRGAGLAEAELGAARGVSHAMFLPIGTGIAGAILIDGKAYPGATGSAGEIGHMCVYPDGERCACGQIGCLEAYASASAIARRYAASGGERGMTTPQIVARTGSDPIATRIWYEATTALGIALAAARMLLDPALFVLGGGLAKAGDALLRPVRADLASRLTWQEAPPIVLAELGSDAGRVGAAILAWRAAGREHLAATPAAEGVSATTNATKQYRSRESV